MLCKQTLLNIVHHQSIKHLQRHDEINGDSWNYLLLGFTKSQTNLSDLHTTDLVKILSDYFALAGL